MKILLTVIVLYMVAIIATSTLVLGKGNSKKVLNNSTEHSFSGAAVRGRYHTSGEAIATIEDEKVIKNLLTVRKDFKDRVKKSFLEQ